MLSIASDIAAFRRLKQAETRRARATVAAGLLAGIDLPRLLSGGEPDRAAARLVLRRRLERERQKGTRGHWSYDLDRHVALKQALDLLAEGVGTAMDPGEDRRGAASPKMPGTAKDMRRGV